MNRCPFAVQVTDLVPDKPRTGPVFGLVVHTSGRGIVERARRRGEDVLEHAVAYYRAAACSAHYVGGPDGQLVQITADDRMVPHVGIATAERALYLSNRWRTDRRLASTAVDRWSRTWFNRSPTHLFPGASANAAYVGIELLPVRQPSGLWYTPAQHDLVARLYLDLHRRHGWRWSTGVPNSRLLGHEDLDAFGRWDRGGGWDPGALRAVPRFSWPLVWRALGRGLA